MIKKPVFSFKRKLIDNTNNVIHLPIDIIRTLGWSKGATIEIGLEKGEDGKRFMVIWEDKAKKPQIKIDENFEVTHEESAKEIKEEVLQEFMIPEEAYMHEIREPNQN